MATPTTQRGPSDELEFRPGKRTDNDIKVVRGSSGGWITMPTITICGKGDGPTVWLSAAIHGDELNGVEIIRQVTKLLSPARLRGRIIAVPIVNVMGFTTGERYLPDRRDLNRCFPGSKSGSLGARIAYLFREQIVDRSDVGIDLHTASGGRSNLPQIRADLNHGRTEQLARAFGAPMIIHARVRDGSLRETAARDGKSVLLYEAGEANRFDQEAIELGVRGTMSVLAKLDMVDQNPTEALLQDSEIANDTHVSRETKWVRAPRSGILRSLVKLGDMVQPSQLLGMIADPFGGGERPVRSRITGMVIGRAEEPVVNQGDGLFHIARIAPEVQLPD